MLSIAFRTRGYVKTDDKTYNTTNTDTPLQKVCKTCSNNPTNVVKYSPLKTTKHTDNMSQKMKYASFIRRIQEKTISPVDAINFRFRNL